MAIIFIHLTQSCVGKLYIQAHYCTKHKTSQPRKILQHLNFGILLPSTFQSVTQDFPNYIKKKKGHKCDKTRHEHVSEVSK